MKLKILLLGFMIILNASGCDENTSNEEYYDIVNVKARISYIDSNGIDLLDENNNDAYKDIEIYQHDGNRKTEIDFHLALSDKTQLQNNYIGFLLNNNNAFYIQLNEHEIDTVYGIIEEYTDNGFFSRTLTKIIYNGVEMTHEGDTTGVFTIIKE